MGREKNIIFASRLSNALTREFKKTTTATATGTSLDKRFNEWNNLLCTCVKILCTLLCRALQNNNVK